MCRILFFLSFVFFSSVLFSQEKSCCQTNVSFAGLSEDKAFRDAHQLPKDFVLQNAKGKMIKFKTEDGKEANAYFIESPEASKKFILVFHEWWGLNDNIKRESDELQDKLGNVNILALDLYDGVVATKREDAAKLMQSNDKNRSMEIIKGAIKFAGKDAEIGTIGWCFGGGWSLQASILAGKQGKACVIYYGIIENTPETFKDLHAPVLGIFAEKDGWITPDVYKNLEKNLKAAGKKVTIRSFNADHAFANPSNTNFDEKATKEAKELTIKFFKENLIR
ncbi:dienelactone hydrolase family protein [Ignavibacterium album]|uniref:dienelactone hydrolase family protein n=1 Tax=Ignavibacterium album TaxID=591197 RepID=UPI0026E9D888|nr:dienelactone hydrolase family protein [Ignavibacterium album]